jgi:Regulator of chromosome condensation (RCC1) repeat
VTILGVLTLAVPIVTISPGSASAFVITPITTEVLTAGDYHTCGLTSTGAADCWGDNNDGQAADQVGPYTQLTAGLNHTCGLTSTGAADCWGDNGSGQAADQTGPYGVYVPPVAPSVTIDQASGQTDPTAVSPVHFTVVFSAPVTGFATGDVTLAGTANATSGTVTETAPNDGTTTSPSPG